MRGSEGTDQIPRWCDIQSEWLRVLDGYADCQPGDVAHWYGEPATLSTLAGAVWRLGGHCLQEYTCEKGEAFGRGDLWFRLQADAFTVEAKQFWPESGEDARRNLAGCLEQACADVGRHHDREGVSHRVGVVFVTPHFRASLGPIGDAHVEEILEIGASMPCAGRAWWFPQQFRDLRSPWKARTGYFPGALMVARYVGLGGG